MAVRYMTIEQSLIHGARISPIKVFDVEYALLTKDILDNILAAAATTSDTNTNINRIGLASSYNRKGALRVLALASITSVILLKIPASGSKTRDVDTGSEPLLQQFFVDNHIFYAFDAHALALSLHNDMSLDITTLIDIQSSTGPKNNNRDTYRTVTSLLQDTTYKINKDNFLATFKSAIWDEKLATALAQRAWISFFITTIEEIKLKMLAVPFIDTKKWSDEDLDILSNISKGAIHLDQIKPHYTKHEFKKGLLQTNGELEVVSSRFQNRIRQSNYQALKVEFNSRSGQSVYVSGKTASVKGKRAVLSIPNDLGNENIQSITTIGQDGPTPAELSQSIFLLECLQGKRSFLQNGWFKLFRDAVNTPNTPDIPKTPDISNISDSTFDPWQTSPIPLPKNQKNLLMSPPLIFGHDLNQSQLDATNAMLDHKHINDYTIIQGPPGTGKTTVIAAFVNSILLGSDRTIWLTGKSNISVKNIAEKLYRNNIKEWKLIVSKEFFTEWHAHLYQEIPQSNIITSDKVASLSSKNCRVVLCTLSMLSSISSMKLDSLTKQIPFETLVVDEASQIQIGDYYPIISKLGNNLKKICFIGDDKQLPPFGDSNEYKPESVFEKFDLSRNTILLNTQYRMPIPIGNFISQHVYNGQLFSDTNHPIQTKESCQFFNIEDGQEECYQLSYKNLKEVEAVVQIARHLYSANKKFKIITPYDCQKSLVEETLRTHALAWEDKCFNVDSFQGNEEDYIIISVVRTNELGFLMDERRNNVMLTRAKRGMYICSNANFLRTVAKKTLMGRLAAEWKDRSWLEWSDIRSGEFHF